MHGRKVRSAYYSQLGLSNPALSSALDAIFSADVIDVDKLVELYGNFDFPYHHRPAVWSVLLGVSPRYREAWDWAAKERAESFEDLKRAAKLLRPPGISPRRSGSQSEALGFYECLRVHQEIDLSRPRPEPPPLQFHTSHVHDIAGIFRSVFESEADAYWCFEKFMQRVHGRSLATQVNVVVVWTEAQDPELWKHLTESGVDVRAAVDQWFGCLFVTYLPVSAIERIFDRLVIGSFDFLIYVAVAIFQLLRNRLLNSTTEIEFRSALMARAPSIDPHSYSQLNDLANTSAVISRAAELFTTAHMAVQSGAISRDTAHRRAGGAE